MSEVLSPGAWQARAALVVAPEGAILDQSPVQQLALLHAKAGCDWIVSAVKPRFGLTETRLLAFAGPGIAR